MRRPPPHGRLVLAVLIAIAAASGVAYAWTGIPPSAGAKAAVLEAVAGYELAPAPVWREAYRGVHRLSPEARDVIQAACERKLGAVTTAGVPTTPSSYAAACGTASRRAEGTRARRR